MNQQDPNQPMVYPLFSAPIYTHVVRSFELPDIKKFEFTSRGPTGEHPFLSSVNKHILDLPEFKQIHDILLEEIDNHARNTLCVSNKIEFYITNSWININRPGDQCAPHTHNNSLISGVLYLKSPERSGELFFYRDILSLLPFPPALDLETSAQNIFNSKHFGIDPKVNEVCLFPSVIMHSAGINESSEERWCLPFNVFIRGDVGGLHELTLK